MQTTVGTPTLSAILCFLLIVALTLVVTYWAARRTRSTREFYAAGRSISPLQNGLALAGDYMSAASFLGIAGLVALRGYDGMIYATGWLVGWPALMFLIAEPLRNLGKFTFADVVAFRLRQVPVRIASSVGGLLTLLFYVLAQMVGAGNLIALMFGLPYEWAVLCVGTVMLAYVLFGGMIATTWVQIIKAILLLCGVSVLTVLVMAQFHFSFGTLYEAVAAKYGQAALEPGGLVTDAIDAVSLGLALMFGLLGLPHILMRFYTVPDAKAARTSVLYATGFVGYFYLIIPIVGFGASVLIGRDVIRKIDAGGNMAAPLLAEMLGGHAVSRVHRRRRVCHDSRGRGRTDAGRRQHHLARSVHARRAQGTRERAGPNPRRAYRHRRVRRAGGRARHPVQGTERGVHGGPGLCRGRECELSAAAALDGLASLQHGRRRLLDHRGRPGLGHAHRAEPHGLGRPAPLPGGHLPMAESRDLLHADQFPVRLRRLAGHARTGGRGQVRR